MLRKLPPSPRWRVAGGIASGSLAGARSPAAELPTTWARSTDMRFHQPEPVEHRSRRLGQEAADVEARPLAQIPEAAPGAAPAGKVCDGEIAVTMINHATLLIQMDGINILTDPIWAERSVPTVGVKRHRPAGLRFEDLPKIDASSSRTTTRTTWTCRRCASSGEAATSLPSSSGLRKRVFLARKGVRRRPGSRLVAVRGDRSRRHDHRRSGAAPLQSLSSSTRTGRSGAGYVVTGPSGPSTSPATPAGAVTSPRSESASRTSGRDPSDRRLHAGVVPAEAAHRPGRRPAGDAGPRREDDDPDALRHLPQRRGGRAARRPCLRSSSTRSPLSPTMKRARRHPRQRPELDAAARSRPRPRRPPPSRRMNPGSASPGYPAP